MSVYLDNNSTTIIDSSVMEEMLPFLNKYYANASSPHSDGEYVRECIEAARENVAKVIKAENTNIHFTSSATEANNIALKGLWLAAIKQNKILTFITTKTEHSSVLECLKSLRDVAIVRPIIKFLSVSRSGSIDICELEQILKCSVNPVVSIMAANNEVGTVHDVSKISDLCRRFEAYFHCDATQAIGKVNIDVCKMNIDSISMSAHKIHGPKGVGALYLKNSSSVMPIIDGGYQNIITSGTINTPAIIGFGKACTLLIGNDEDNIRMRELRDYLLKLLLNNIDGLIVNGTMNNRLQNNLNISVPGITTDVMISNLDDVMISGSSACNSIGNNVSHVLLEMGTIYPECALRFGLSKFTTQDDIEYAAEKIIKVANEVRQ